MKSSAKGIKKRENNEKQKSLKCTGTHIHSMKKQTIKKFGTKYSTYRSVFNVKPTQSDSSYQNVFGYFNALEAFTKLLVKPTRRLIYKLMTLVSKWRQNEENYRVPEVTWSEKSGCAAEASL